MKTKLFKTLNYFAANKRQAIILLITLFFLGCKKDVKTQNDQLIANQQLEEQPAETKTVKLKKLTVELLSLSKNKNFTEIVFTECKKQKHGDYYVSIEELFNNKSVISVVPAQNIHAILNLVSDLKKIGLRNPILFYPSVETKENQLPSVPTGIQDEADDYIAVINDDKSGGVKDEYPGYRFNTAGQLEYVQQITEEFAWDNDVWVIGDEENCSEGNMVAAPNDDGIMNERYQGQSEYAGLIQVTDIGAIESWISGKLELKMTVLNSSGAIVSGPRAFGKWARSNFTNNKWKDFNHFVGYWYTSTFGNWMYEHWMEEDGGNSNSTTITMPPPPGTPGPTISTTIPSRNLDDDLGLATIQFTDPISTVYNISYANIKRKN